MSTIKLTGDIIKDAKNVSNIFNRSISEQIEHWVKIGKIAEENPDLTYNFIKNVLISIDEAEQGELKSYSLGKTK